MCVSECVNVLMSVNVSKSESEFAASAGASAAAGVTTTIHGVQNHLIILPSPLLVVHLFSAIRRTNVYLWLGYPPRSVNVHHLFSSV